MKLNTKAKILFGLLFACIAMQAQAQLQLKGTLFTSPEQRTYLDYLRADFLAKSLEKGFDIEDTAIPEIPVDVVEEQAPKIYTYGGVMTRKDGSNTIWLNGKLTSTKELPAGTSLVNNQGVMTLRFNTENGVFNLKPGQTLELGAGKIIETIERKTVTPPVITNAAVTGETSIDTSQADTAITFTADVAATQESSTTALPDSLSPAASSKPLADSILDLDQEAIESLIETLETKLTQIEDSEDATD